MLYRGALVILSLVGAASQGSAEPVTVVLESGQSLTGLVERKPTISVFGCASSAAEWCFAGHLVGASSAV